MFADLSPPRAWAWIICGMRSPGMNSPRPIRTMDEEDHFAEVFYDEVRIPVAQQWSMEVDRGLKPLPCLPSRSSGAPPSPPVRSPWPMGSNGLSRRLIAAGLGGATPAVHAVKWRPPGSPSLG